MQKNTQKPVINLAELAVVTTRFPQPLRQRLPLPVLQVRLYDLAIENQSLIEEVEAVYDHEEARRNARPVMFATR